MIKNIFSCHDLNDLLMLVILHLNRNRPSIQSLDDSTY